MKVSYRNHTITVDRDGMLYYSIEYDGYECESGFSETRDSVRTMTKLLKERIDNELREEYPWGEFVLTAHGLAERLRYE